MHNLGRLKGMIAYRSDCSETVMAFTSKCGDSYEIVRCFFIFFPKIFVVTHYVSNSQFSHDKFTVLKEEDNHYFAIFKYFLS